MWPPGPQSLADPPYIVTSSRPKVVGSTGGNKSEERERENCCSFAMVEVAEGEKNSKGEEREREEGVIWRERGEKKEQNNTYV